MAKRDLENKVLMAARDSNINSVLFRNAVRSQLNLNITDSECLSFLSIKGVSTPKEISEYTGLTTGATTTMLDRLEKSEYIQRNPNPNDRRGSLIQINSKWTETVGPLVKGIQQAQAELVASYSAEELTVIADFLTRFAKNVEENTEKIAHQSK